MIKPTRKWTIDIIHHSHTDIGYTERQEKIERYHVHFIRQALQILQDAKCGAKKEWLGFKWTCETFWAVERFLQQATPAEKAAFQAFVQSGDISLSGTYLNMTELIDAPLLARMINRSVDYAKSIGVTVDSAMTADINGYSWGFAQCLVDAGIEHLFSCIHTHHGMFPLGRKQTPFWWETPRGQRLLVWNGEHYMVGNDLGLAPNAFFSYTIHDELARPSIADNHWTAMETRIMRYLHQLEQEAYPYDFVPVMLSGLLTDNASPNGAIMELVNRWNEAHGEEVFLQMTTLSDFFAKLKRQSAEIPVYRGDWPDWWSDGPASTAAHTQLFRDAQRQFRLVTKLDPRHEVIPEANIREMEEQLTLYAEHTWGYSHSVTEPWNPMVQSLGARKEAYAANASRLVHTAMDAILEAKGEAMLAPGRELRFKVLNPHATDIVADAKMYLDDWELPKLKQGFEVRDEASGEVYAHQLSRVSRGAQVAISTRLQAGEEKVFRIIPTDVQEEKTTSSLQLLALDRVKDVRDFHAFAPALRMTENAIESPHVLIAWEVEKGIVRWLDKQTGIDLIDEAAVHAAFSPIYEVTPADRQNEMGSVRRKMGRNRKGMNVQRDIGALVSVTEIERGPRWLTCELTYNVKGMSYYVVRLTVFADEPKVDVSVRLHKESVWAPENVYLSLPFRLADGQLWLEKAGAVIRPEIDQLPGTGADFYSVQEGVAWVGSTTGLSIAMPDSPLVQVGPITFGERRLSAQPSVERSNEPLYAWVLNNFWETNFKATVGGFYEFRYSLFWGQDVNSPDKAIAQCHLLNQGTVCYRI